LYAPLAVPDVRIGNWLYLKLAEAIPEEATVVVDNPSGALWSPHMQFTARAEALRWNPAIHVNQIGYLTSAPKEAIIGYYLGSLGELDISARTFHVVDARDGEVVFTGLLNRRPDRGFTYAVAPYQHVMEADFSLLTVPGEYRLVVPGMGASLPFLIDDRIAAAFARTYALGFYHQRCGAANQLPFTRFIHGPCHTAPAAIPTMAFRTVNEQLERLSRGYDRNPRHTAPPLKDVKASLYPFVNRGTVDVSGGHHDAGDYSKYTVNSAQLIHYLVFAADAFPGVAELDNLGLPESGDGVGDVLQLAKWEADFLVKMQDADGGFYFLVHPRDRAYESDVLPDQGDPQVVFPKTTAATAAAVAALAQAGSSPSFKRAFPHAASHYLEVAEKGWAFLQRAFARYGRDGSYQKIGHYGDTFMHDDEIAWAATELFLATGDPAIHADLLDHFDPADRRTRRWGWQRLSESYGAAIRSYAFAPRTGRMPQRKLNLIHLKKCVGEILARAEDLVGYTRDNAYATSFPIESKRYRTAGWYFPIAEAFDLAVAYHLHPDPEFFRSLISNINFEGGTNPNNIVFLTGLGWRRQCEIVHQYAQNDRRLLPPSGIPLGSLQRGFVPLPLYGDELKRLSFPSDDDDENPYPLYDRWADTFNVTTEFTVATLARGLATLAFLMARTPLKNQPWRCARAHIVGLPDQVAAGVPITVRLSVDGLSLDEAFLIWEAKGQSPTFGHPFTFTPQKPGDAWIEVEAQWPDGRRAFAMQTFHVTEANRSQGER
ncbi:MAG: glycoside hydrolase family 9, partial [Acidobacteria bacterium]